jgi:hypothetical protein
MNVTDSVVAICIEMLSTSYALEWISAQAHGSGQWLTPINVPDDITRGATNYSAFHSVTYEARSRSGETVEVTENDYDQTHY